MSYLEQAAAEYRDAHAQLQAIQNDEDGLHAGDEIGRRRLATLKEHATAILQCARDVLCKAAVLLPR